MFTNISNNFNKIKIERSPKEESTVKRNTQNPSSVEGFRRIENIHSVQEVTKNNSLLLYKKEAKKKRASEELTDLLNLDNTRNKKIFKKNKGIHFFQPIVSHENIIQSPFKLLSNVSCAANESSSNKRKYFQNFTEANETKKKDNKFKKIVKKNLKKNNTDLAPKTKSNFRVEKEVKDKKLLVSELTENQDKDLIKSFIKVLQKRQKEYYIKNEKKLEAIKANGINVDEFLINDNIYENNKESYNDKLKYNRTKDHLNNSLKKSNSKSQNKSKSKSKNKNFHNNINKNISKSNNKEYFKRNYYTKNDFRKNKTKDNLVINNRVRSNSATDNNVKKFKINNNKINGNEEENINYSIIENVNGNNGSSYYKNLSQKNNYNGSNNMRINKLEINTTKGTGNIKKSKEIIDNLNDYASEKNQNSRPSSKNSYGDCSNKDFNLNQNNKRIKPKINTMEFITKIKNNVSPIKKPLYKVNSNLTSSSEEETKMKKIQKDKKKEEIINFIRTKRKERKEKENQDNKESTNIKWKKFNNFCILQKNIKNVIENSKKKIMNLNTEESEDLCNTTKSSLINKQDYYINCYESQRIFKSNLLISKYGKENGNNVIHSSEFINNEIRNNTEEDQLIDSNKKINNNNRNKFRLNDNEFSEIEKTLQKSKKLFNVVYLKKFLENKKENKTKLTTYNRKDIEKNKERNNINDKYKFRENDDIINLSDNRVRKFSIRRNKPQIKSMIEIISRIIKQIEQRKTFNRIFIYSDIQRKFKLGIKKLSKLTNENTFKYLILFYNIERFLEFSKKIYLLFLKRAFNEIKLYLNKKQEKLTKLNKFIKQVFNTCFIKKLIIFIIKKDKNFNENNLFNVNFTGNANNEDSFDSDTLSQKYNSFMYESQSEKSSITLYPNSEDNDRLHEIYKLLDLQRKKLLEQKNGNTNNEENELRPGLIHYDEILQKKEDGKIGNERGKIDLKENTNIYEKKNNGNESISQLQRLKNIINNFDSKDPNKIEERKEEKEDLPNLYGCENEYNNLNKCINQPSPKGENSNIDKKSLSQKNNEIKEIINDEIDNNNENNFLSFGNKRNTNPIKFNKENDNNLLYFKNMNFGRNNPDNIGYNHRYNQEYNNTNNKIEKENENNNEISPLFLNIPSGIKSKLCEEITEEIVGLILKKELLENESVLPRKSGKSKLSNSITKSQLENSKDNLSVGSNSPGRKSNNGYIKTSNNNTNNNSQLSSSLELMEMNLNSSIFMRTVNEIKQNNIIKHYSENILPKLLKNIAKNINHNYSKIINDLKEPLKVNEEQLINDLEYKIKVIDEKEDYNLSDYFNNSIDEKEEPLLNFQLPYINNKIKKQKFLDEKIINEFIELKNDSTIENIINTNNINEYEKYLNKCIFDTANEIISKKRMYSNIGEPFIWSTRKRILMYEYKDDAYSKKYFIIEVMNELKEILRVKMGLIPENYGCLDTEQLIEGRRRKFIENIKKELKNEEETSQNYEVEKTLIKLTLSKMVMGHLINEVIDILENIQNSRKGDSKFKGKSIYVKEKLPLSSNEDEDFPCTQEPDLDF